MARAVFAASICWGLARVICLTVSSEDLGGCSKEIIWTLRWVVDSKGVVILFLGAFCQGMLGLNNFLPTNGFSAKQFCSFSRGAESKRGF